MKDVALVKYLRQFPRIDKDGTYHKGEPIGVIVALLDGKIGWSVCCPKDRFKKELGRSLAVGRPMTGEVSHIPNRTVRIEFDEDKGFKKVVLADELQERLFDVQRQLNNYNAKKAQNEQAAIPA